MIGTLRKLAWGRKSSFRIGLTGLFGSLSVCLTNERSRTLNASRAINCCFVETSLSIQLVLYPPPVVYDMVESLPIDVQLRPGIPRAFVFSHPNHEAAAIGMITRSRPSKIIYLTDGGGQHRVNETKIVLSQLDLLDNAIFLDRTESSFYDAILNLDYEYFQTIGDSIKHTLEGSRGAYIFCDAVEFYNPVHDMTFPVVKALRIASEIFEIPLVYQNIDGNLFLQKPPTSAALCALSLRLVREERELKKRLLVNEYVSLREQMEALIGADASLTEVEWFLKGRTWPILPSSEQAIRYNARGATLVSQLVYERAISYKGHYVPLTSKLLGDENG